jgi:hypothetical protein
MRKPCEAQRSRLDLCNRPLRTPSLGDAIRRSTQCAPGPAAMVRLREQPADRRQGPSFDMLLTISLRAELPGTMLTLVREGLAERAAAMPDVAASVGPGWEAVLANPGQDPRGRRLAGRPRASRDQRPCASSTAERGECGRSPPSSSSRSGTWWPSRANDQATERGRSHQRAQRLRAEAVRKE